MASIHRQHGKPNWFAAFTTPDGVRRFRSTGTSNKRQAIQIALAYETASR